MRAIACQSWQAHGAFNGASGKVKRAKRTNYAKQRKAERLALSAMDHDGLGELPSYLKSE